MTDERLAELERLANAATPGPWRVVEKRMKVRKSDGGSWTSWVTKEIATAARGEDDRVVGCEYSSLAHDAYLFWGSEADPEFVATARTAVPELLAEVRRLRALVESLGDSA